MKNTEDIDFKEIEQYLLRKNDKLDNSIKRTLNIFNIMIIYSIFFLLFELILFYNEYQSSKRIDKIFHEYDSLRMEIMK